jgi:hypothetical protein
MKAPISLRESRRFMMIKIIVSLLIFFSVLASIVNAEDPQQPSPDNNPSGYMLQLGINTAIFDKPDGVITTILAKDLMIWVSGEKDTYLKISTGGWIQMQGGSTQQPPYNLIVGKKTDVFKVPGDKSEIATIQKNIMITIIETKDGFGRIKIDGWMLKPGVAAEQNKAKPDPYADLKDKGNSVIDIINNRIIHDPDTSLSK